MGSVFQGEAMGKRRVDDRIIKTKKKKFVEANALSVEAGTNGYQGGDYSHGSRTYIRISDLGNTDIRFHIEPNYGRGSLIMELGGDCELSTIIKAFQFIQKTLEDQSKHS